MKLTWFASTTLRIHIGGRILVTDPERAPASVVPQELVSGTDRVFSLAEDDAALQPLEAARWRPRAAPRMIDDAPSDDDVRLFRLASGVVLVDAIGEPALLLVAAAEAEAPRFGRWADDSVVVLLGAGEAMVSIGTALLELARPRLIALAADEAALDHAIAALVGRLDGAALVALEPGLALEV